jgi:hypothetical protein
MNDLDDAIRAALLAKAATAPTPAPPRLGVPAPAPRRRQWLVPVAAAAVVAVGATVLVVTVPGEQPVTPPVATVTTEPPTDPTADPTAHELAPGEVYYALRQSLVGGEVIRERQVWQPRERTGEWRQSVTQGVTIEDGRVVPSGGAVGAREGGACYPAFSVTDGSCTGPATWFNPTVDFLASAPRDPAVIGQQLHALAADNVPDSGRTEETLVDIMELSMIGHLLAGNGVPPDLVAALREVVAALPGVVVTEGMPNLAGVRGTGYSLPHPLTGEVAVIFDAAGHYLGSPKEAVRHGVAPGLGLPPSRMLD